MKSAKYKNKNNKLLSMEINTIFMKQNFQLQKDLKFSHLNSEFSNPHALSSSSMCKIK